MCMNCGCNQPDDRHGNPDNITREDLERAAQANGQSFEQTVQNIERTSQGMDTRAGSGSSSSSYQG